MAVFWIWFLPNACDLLNPSYIILICSPTTWWDTLHLYPLVNRGSEVKTLPWAGSALHGAWAPPQVCLVPKALSPSVQFVQLKKGTVGAWSVSPTPNMLTRRFCRLQMGVSCRECVGDFTWRPLQIQLGFGVQIWSNIGHCCALTSSRFLSSAQEQIHGDFARPSPLQRYLYLFQPPVYTAPCLSAPL